MKNEFKKRLLTSFLIVPLSFFFIIKGSFFFIFFLSIVFLISIYEWIKITKNFNTSKITGVIFIFFSIYAAYLFRNDQGVNIFLFIIVISIFTDLGGYIFGKIFKGPKLTKISPNKTYTGMVGSYFLSILFISLYFHEINRETTIAWLTITILISSVSQIGDIVISYFKRLSKLKNTGNIIPGHGGILDRIDGMIFAFPIYYLIEFSGFLI